MRRVCKFNTTTKGNLLNIFIYKFIAKIIAALVLTGNPCLLQMGWCVQYCLRFKRITTQVWPLPIFDHPHVTPGPFTSFNTKPLWCYSTSNKSKYTSVRQWIHLMPNMRAACHSIFSGKSARKVKRKSFGLKVLEFRPENINNVFNGFIDNILIGIGLFVDFHNNLLNL